MSATQKTGRPPLGAQPMSPAARKRAQRARDTRAAIEAIGHEEKASLKALLAVLGRIDAGNPFAQASARRAWAEIGRRYGFGDSHEM